MRKNTALPLSFASNFIQAPQVVSDTSEANPQRNLLSIGRAWCSISARANQPVRSRLGHMQPGRSARMRVHTHMHTNEPPRPWYISEHGEELIRPHPVSLSTAVTEQGRGKGQTQWSGREHWWSWFNLWPRRSTMTHLTSRSKRSLSLSAPLWIVFLCGCFIKCCMSSDEIWAWLIDGSVTIKKNRELEGDGQWRWRGGLCECIAVSPLLPGAQCRCGGPSPRRHSMVWHALHFSPLTVSSWTSSHANTWATGGFSYLVVGQEYLIIFKKTVRHIIPRLPKYDPLLFSLPLFLPNIFPSTVWEECIQMKRNRYTMVQSWKKKSLADGY